LKTEYNERVATAARCRHRQNNGAMGCSDSKLQQGIRNSGLIEKEKILEISVNLFF